MENLTNKENLGNRELLKELMEKRHQNNTQKVSPEEMKQKLKDFMDRARELAQKK